MSFWRFIYGFEKRQRHGVAVKSAATLFAVALVTSGCVAEDIARPIPSETPPAMTTPEPDSAEPRAEKMSGTFLGAGVTCPQFRLDTGEQVSLSGRTDGMKPGAHYTIHGAVALRSKCMQGREIRVTSVLLE